MYYNSWLHTEQIEKLRETRHIADILDSHGKIKSIPESKILQWHYWVVPWVITEDIARILAWFYPRTSLETIFKKKLKPGDQIGFFWWRGEPEIYTPGETRVSIMETYNISWTSYISWTSLREFPLPQEYEFQEMIPSLLSDHLLQSWDFQLASGASRIDSEWYFSGHYTIPENHPFLTEEWLPFPFMKEVANQIISLSASLQNNPNGIKNRSTILLLSSHIAQDENNKDIILKWWSSILVTGRAHPDQNSPKRNVIAEYSTYLNSKALFHGIIKWIQSKTKILFK